MNIIFKEKFIKGQLLLIDKPLHWTSFDAVNYVRQELKRKAGIKVLKVGHAGTLDPLATGLVIICTGPMTKKINEFQDMEKEYIGQITLGATTPSFDLETEIDATYPTEHLNNDLIYQAASSFVGTIEQFPPIYSAIKIKGKRAYNYARQGEEVKIKSKIVTIHSFDIQNIDNNVITFRIKCSKGTYIRSIANDIGKKLNSGAHLSALRRTAIGNHLVINATTPENFTKELVDNLEV